MTPHGTLPTSTFVNPIYEAREKGKKEETQQPEERNLRTIVPEKKGQALPKKYKSTTPRGSKATTERKPQNITVMPARPEKIIGGLTKIALPSSFGKMPVSPRDKFEPNERSKARLKNIAPDIIDEDGESSGESSKTKSSEDDYIQPAKSPHFTVDELKSRILNKKPPPLPITREKPSEFKRVKPASTTRSNLGMILSPRERKNSPEPTDAWKAPSDDADVQERDREFPKVPLLRTDRVLNLERAGFGRASSLSRPLTQRSRVVPMPEAAVLLNQPDAQQRNSNMGDQELLDVKPTVGTLPPRIEIEQSGIIDPQISIPSDSDQAQPQKDIRDDADEFVERSEEFPDEIDSAAKGSQEGVQKREQQKFLMRGKGLSKVNPKTSSDLAETITYLIKREPSPEVGSVRAMNALYWAAGGRVPVDPNKPETRVYADKLIDTPNEQRYEYLKALFDQLELHLPSALKQEIRGSLANLYSNTYFGGISLLEGDLKSIRTKLEKELASLL